MDEILEFLVLIYRNRKFDYRHIFCYCLKTDIEKREHMNWSFYFSPVLYTRLKALKQCGLLGTSLHVYWTSPFNFVITEITVFHACKVFSVYDICMGLFISWCMAYEGPYFSI